MTTINNDRDLTVSFCRVLAMMMVVAAHYTNLFEQISIFGFDLNSNILSEFFSIGVYIFFFISGYLYGNKKIVDKKIWIKKRVLRIFIPLYIYLFLDYTIFGNQIQIKSLLLQLVNMQGVYQILPLLKHVPGPWFFSVIMIDYLLLLIVDKHFRIEETNISKHHILLLLLLFVCSVCGINISGIYVFFCGYLYAKNRKNTLLKIKNKNFYFLIVFIFAIIIRLISIKVLSQENIYTLFVVPISTLLIVISILETVDLLIKDNARLKELISSNIFSIVDSVSIYVYLFHEKLFILANTSNVILSIISYFVVLLSTVLFSYLLYKIGNYIECKISKLIGT